MVESSRTRAIALLERNLLPTPSAANITQLLLAWRAGDENALVTLIPLVYAELRRLARRRMRNPSPDQSLQTTALINETYLRLVGTRVAWQNRAHFYAVCAQAMRRILVDNARARGSRKRGGDRIHVPFGEWIAAAPARDRDLLALDEALTELAAAEPRRSRVVELRYFGGLSVDETADALKMSPQTVMRDWNAARLWLLRALDRRAKEEP
jgi:RNA polymerase sigma factor (TIGR02999 family)